MATRRDANAIARSLNRLTDSAFMGTLSENNSAAMAATPLFVITLTTAVFIIVIITKT